MNRNYKNVMLIPADIFYLYFNQESSSTTEPLIRSTMGSLEPLE